MKKLVLKVHAHDEKAKQKAMKAVSKISGIESMSIDLKEQKLTIIGDVDPLKVVEKLRKHYAEIVSVGPKEEKKDDKKGGDGKKDEDKKGDGKNPWPYPYYCPPYYMVVPQDDYPNNCVIC